MSLTGKWFSFGKNEHYDNGVRLYQVAEYEQAIEQFKICLSSDPDVSTRERARSYMAGALGKLARLEVEQEKWEKALHYLDDAVLIRPGFADLRILRAQVFHALKREDDRMFEIKFTLDLNPRYGFAILHDAIYKMEHGDPATGVERIKKAIEEDPRLDSDDFQEAMRLYENGDSQGAIARLKTVVPVMDSDPEGIIQTGDGFAHKGRWHDAEESYRRAIEIAPGFADFRCKHGQALLQLDEIGQAIAQFREAVTINPQYADAYAMLGIAYRRDGNEENALDAFRMALQIDPAHVVASHEIERRP